MTSDSHHLSILTDQEIDDLYGLPRFNDENRRPYFKLSPAKRSAIEAHTGSVAVYLAMQLGYFKENQQFFVYEPDAVANDMRFSNAHAKLNRKQRLLHMTRKYFAVQTGGHLCE